MLRARQSVTGSSDPDQALERAQRRLLRRVYNGRSTPIVIEGTPLRTYREASRYLLSLAPDARESAFAEMRRLGAERPSIAP